MRKPDMLSIDLIDLWNGSFWTAKPHSQQSKTDYFLRENFQPKGARRTGLEPATSGVTGRCSATTLSGDAEMAYLFGLQSGVAFDRAIHTEQLTSKQLHRTAASFANRRRNALDCGTPILADQN